jgi:hypothetical protein
LLYVNFNCCVYGGRVEGKTNLQYHVDWIFHTSVQSNFGKKIQTECQMLLFGVDRNFFPRNFGFEVSGAYLSGGQLQVEVKAEHSS